MAKKQKTKQKSVKKKPEKKPDEKPNKKPNKKPEKKSDGAKAADKKAALRKPAVKVRTEKSSSPKKSAVPRAAVKVKKRANKSNPHTVLAPGHTGNPFHSLRFAGVSLGGGKTDKTAVAILEYYPDRKRVFLRTLRDKLGGGPSEGAAPTSGHTPGADQQLHVMFTEEENHLTSITFDAPLQLPKCIRCDLVCPGMERCKLPEIKWMWHAHSTRAKHKRPNKMFTPYTERCAEIYIANELEEPFHPSHALGSNAAPLTARAHYITRRLETPAFEAFPKLTLWRIGLALHIPKSYLRFHKHAVDSDEARHYILKTLVDKEIAFIYQQDLKILVENGQAFDAFLCALNGFLKHRGQTEPPPPGFPKEESWIDFPKEHLVWF